MQKKLNIEIAEESFQVILEKVNRRFVGLINEYLNSFLKPSGQNGCTIRVMTYSKNGIHHWPVSDLEQLRKFFISIQRRFPPAKGLDEKVDKWLSILTSVSYGEISPRGLVSDLDRIQHLIFAGVGDDLYVYDHKKNTALFCIKKRLRSAGMLTALINGIMCVLSQRLMQTGGLLVHGSALQKQGLGVLFLGLSGAGKSTITRLCDPDICFSDDGVIIKNRADGVYAYQSPFGQVRTNGGRNGDIKGEIQKVFLLEKSTHTSVLPMVKSELMSIILKHLIHFFKFLPPETAELGFYTVKEMLERLPGYRLQFAKNTKIWDNIGL